MAAFNSDVEQSDISRRGMAIYEATLKAKLEPEHNNEYIAIHPDSEDYALARTTGEAMRAIRKVHSEGGLLLMRIGPEPEYSLAARILAGEMMAGGQQK